MNKLWQSKFSFLVVAVMLANELNVISLSSNSLLSQN